MVASCAGVGGSLLIPPHGRITLITADEGQTLSKPPTRAAGLRIGGPVRVMAGIIPEDFEARAAAYDANRGRQSTSGCYPRTDLDRQVTSDGATWLDRQPVGRDHKDLGMSGFGAYAESLSARRNSPTVASR
jgi:Protein of unknown function (DUF3363)